MKISIGSCIVRVKHYLPNFWMITQYFIKAFGADLPVVNGEAKMK